MKKGDKVTWHSPQGTIHGKVIERKTSDFTLDGNDVKASDDEPKYVVQSNKTGAKAAHIESALTAG